MVYVVIDRWFVCCGNRLKPREKRIYGEMNWTELN